MILGKRPPPPWEAESILRDYVRGIRPGAVRTSGDPVEMWEFLTCVLQQAYLPRWLGWRKDDRLDVMKMVERVEGMPPIWLVQGEQDSVVSGFFCLFWALMRKMTGTLTMLMTCKYLGPAHLLYWLCGEVETGSAGCPCAA